MTGRHVLAAALAAIGLAALLAILAVGRLDDGAPVSTTYIVGPPGDDVVIAPRSAP